MGLEPISPSDSGRASPVSRKRTFGIEDDEPLNKDKAYRRYASGVERSLSLFDTQLQEWADYISFLGRLLKSLQQHPPKITAVPSKALVAKRLSQCLTPNLPSGVHQKALEVYSFIFSLIGKDGLARDLGLYLDGLSSTLCFASLSVRPPFLSILEAHLLKLDEPALRPAMNAIILSLLPGLEEETSEDFERTLKILDGFKAAIRSKRRPSVVIEGTGDEYFWQCFFKASIMVHHGRAGALAYLVRNLPRLGGNLRRESIISTNSTANGESDASLELLADVVTTPEPGLLLRCFVAGLRDDQILIQRGFLDLLVTHLPVHSNVLQHRVKSEDLELLLKAATGVVIRRDMSLNRRLWTWLMGPEPSEIETEAVPGSPISANGDHPGVPIFSRTRYFEEYGLQPLTKAILKMIEEDHVNPVARARPFRICLSLMDRWEIGGLVVPGIFLPVISGVRRYKDQALSKADFNDVLRSASVFFDGVESGLIWGELMSLLDSAFGKEKLIFQDSSEKLTLVSFVLTHFNVREEEMLMIHAPVTAVAILAMVDDLEMKQKQYSSSEDTGWQAILRLALNIVLDLIDLIPERAFQFDFSDVNTAEAQQRRAQDGRKLSNELIIRRIRSFYVDEQGNLDEHSSPIPPGACSDLLLREAARITSQGLTRSSPDLGLRTKLLCTIVAKSPKADSLDSASLLSAIHQKTPPSSTTIPFATFDSIVHVLNSLYPKSYIARKDISDLVDPIVRIAWSFLISDEHQVETVRALWQLQNALSLENHEIESAICAIITEKEIHGTFAAREADPGRRFGVLWTHTLQDNASYGTRRSSSSTITMTGGNYGVMLTRPLFLLLDSLEQETQLSVWVKAWLQSLNNIEKLFQLFVVRFASFSFLRFATPQKRSEGIDKQSYAGDDDLDGCLYYLKTFKNILRCSSDHTWAALAHHTVSTERTHQKLYGITGVDGEISLQEFFVHVCMQTIAGNHDSDDPSRKTSISAIHRTALSVLHRMLQGPYSLPLADLNLEHWLINRLSASLSSPDPFIQVPLSGVVSAAVRLRNSSAASLSTNEQKKSNTQESLLNPRPSFADADNLLPSPPPPPPSLVKCLQAGFAARSSRPILDNWITLLTECMPLYSESIFQILIPLVDTFCTQIGQSFADLQRKFQKPGSATDEVSGSLISLLNGLHQVLAVGHRSLEFDEPGALPIIKSPDVQQGFFGNMVSGVFPVVAPQARSVTANNRLTVLLSFQDAVRICYQIWSWDGEGNVQSSETSLSFAYTSLRMRNRARRLLEHLFEAEALECLETVVDIWQKSTRSADTKQNSVFNLLQVLDGSRPKHTIPAIFNAIYNRTNSNALEPARKSTLTLDTDFVVFLVEYAKSLDDDAMDEIWSDCMAFLRDILANPFPYRQTLPSLLQFAAILGEKVDNTNFGEQRKMRRELADLFLRLLTAAFTTKPMGFSEVASISEKSIDSEERQSPSSRSEDIVGILASVAPNLSKILVEPDRVLSAVMAISTNVIGPTFRSKAFPENVSKSVLVLLYHLARLPNTQKIWRKDLEVAFSDSKFFTNSLSLVESDWVPLLRQWTLSDKERMPELLTRLAPPTTAGIVFGVGATSARLEADRKTQLILRRIATLILAAADETFIIDLPTIQEKLVELLSATSTSSPSSTTRAELYMVLRALVLKTSAIHLASLWPIIIAELHAALSSVASPDNSQTSQTYTSFAVLQACKLLDTLLCIAPDDFQRRQWRFIIDTVDAVHRPTYFPQQRIPLIDELSEELGSTSLTVVSDTRDLVSGSPPGLRRPLLGPGGISDDINLERKEDLIAKVLRPFFGQLSIYCFESIYEMGSVDMAGLRQGLLKDLFDERGQIKDQ